MLRQLSTGTCSRSARRQLRLPSSVCTTCTNGGHTTKAFVGALVVVPVSACVCVCVYVCVCAPVCLCDECRICKEGRDRNGMKEWDGMCMCVFVYNTPVMFWTCFLISRHFFRATCSCYVFPIIYLETVHHALSNYSRTHTYTHVPFSPCLYEWIAHTYTTYPGPCSMI